jgi:hypothetical protein
MRSMSSTVITVWNGGLLAFEFFHAKGFFGETFIFLDVSVSVRGYLGSVTSPLSFLYSSPSTYSFSTSSPPLPLGESDVVSSDVLFNFCTSSFFFFLLLLGASYSLQVTIGLPLRLGSQSSIYLTGMRNFARHSLVISSISSSVSL